MRILSRGRIYLGDNAQLVESHPESMSCAFISKLAFDASFKTKDTLNLLVEDTNLLGMNQALFRRKLSIIQDAELLGKNAWKGWHAFKADRIADEGDRIKSFYLKPLMVGHSRHICVANSLVSDHQRALFENGPSLTWSTMQIRSIIKLA
jgi:hypothetical protein